MVGVLLDTVTYPLILKKHICNLYSVILFCHLEKKFSVGESELSIKQTDLANELSFSIGEVRSGFSGLKDYYTTSINRKEHLTIVRRNLEAITCLWKKITQSDILPCEPSPSNVVIETVKKKVVVKKEKVVKAPPAPKPKVEKVLKEKNKPTPKQSSKSEPLYMKNCKELWFNYLKENELPPAFNGIEYKALQRLTSDIKAMVIQDQGLIDDIDLQITKSFEIFIYSREYYNEFHKTLFNLSALNKYSKDIFNSIKNGKRGITNQQKNRSIGETNADIFGKGFADELTKRY